MTRKLATVLVDDRPVGTVQPTTIEEGPVVVAGQEARLLALAAVHGSEPGAFGLGTRFRLGLVAERKDDAVELGRIELRQHVRLVLVRIDGAGEEPPAPVLEDAGIVTCGQRVGAGVAGKGEQAVESERPVAAHARVGGLAAGIALHERVDHRAAKSSRRSSVTCGTPSA